MIISTIFSERFRQYRLPLAFLMSAFVVAAVCIPQLAAVTDAAPASATGSRALLITTSLPSSPSVPGPVQVSAPPPPVTQMVHWAYMVGDKLPDALANHPDQIDILSPAWFRVDADGNISGHDSPAVSAFARSHGIKLVPIVANGSFQASVSHTLTVDGNRQTRMMDSLQWLVNNFGYDGVNIDFENVAGTDRDGLSALVFNVSQRLHPLNKLVTIALPSKTHETYSGFSGAFDYAGLAPNVDYAVLMAYDQHYSGGPAGPIADIAWVSDVVNYAKATFAPGKLLLGLPLYGYNWNVSAGGTATPMSYGDIVSTVFAHGAQIRMVDSAQSPTFAYDGGNGIHQVWFENSTSLQAKLDLASNKGVAGWAVWRLGQEDPNFWTLNLTQPASSMMAQNRVKNAG